MTNKLLEAMDELIKEEQAKKKKKPIFKLRKEKSVMYYSGWHKGKPIKEEKTEKQSKLV